ncbi:MAG: hypothetical protein GX621_09415 [Pirellulaceae bacterium]|nr:hypothetical protein [Pirellulaceae bacterium]
MIRINTISICLSAAMMSYCVPALSSEPSPSLVLTGDTVFVVSPDEPEAVQRAVRDVRDDWYKVLGRLPTVLEAPPEKKTWKGPLVYLGYKAPWFKELSREQFAGPESFVLMATRDSRGNPALVATGSDARGAIYAAYALSEELLGVDPWYYWVDKEPEYKGRVEVTSDYRKHWGPPTFKYRGFFINDEDFLSWFSPDPLNENVFSLSAWDRIYELILRLRGNTIVPGTFPFPDERSGDLASRRGLVNSQHHILAAGLNTYFFPEPSKYSYVKHPELFERYWTVCIDALKDYETVWTVGFRGMHDRPFWWNDPEIKTPQQRGEVIGRAIAKQVELIRRVQPEADIIANLWWEGADLWHDGHLHLPEGVTVVWADDGMGNIRDKGRVSEGQGIYYHTAMYNGRANQISELVNPGRIHHEMCRFIRAKATEYFVVNTSDIRPVPMTTDYCMRLAWDASEELEKSDQQAMDDCLLDFSRRQFGDAVAPELAKIYDEYFTTPYLQKRLRGDCGVVRTAWNMANMLNNWVVKNERPDQKSLDEVKSELSMYEENTARFKNLYERALALYPDVPANRRDFYQFHVLTTLDLYRRAFATNAMLADAVLAMAEGDRDKAIGHARTAVDEFDRIFSALRKAEYPPWRGWHAGEIFVHLTPTRHAIIRCSASLSGEAPPPPINVRENYRRIQEYQEPFLKNFPLMYPPKTR